MNNVVRLLLHFWSILIAPRVMKIMICMDMKVKNLAYEEISLLP